MADNRFRVMYAVYGALKGGNENESQAVSVMDALQNLLERPGGESSIITINNNNLVDVDPSPGNTKHFGACVRIDGKDTYFACQEGQTINFSNWLSATAVDKTEMESAK